MCTFVFYSGQTMTKKSYPKTPLDLPRFFPRRYSTPELAMRKHALKHLRDSSDEQPISNKSCQTDILGLDKYLQRSPPADVQAPQDSVGGSAAALRAYRKPSKKPKVRSVGVHCERRRLTFAAFKGCQKFKHVYKRKISLPQPSSTTCTSTDDGRQDSGMLPKLRLDRTETTERPTAAKTGPAVKLPRISTKDATKPETDRWDDGGGCGGAGARGTRLAKLSRPQSTGSGGSSSGDRKLAYFRANSAPKIDSRYYTLIAKPPPPQPSTTREQQSTAGSSDTADTTLDMSFVRHLHLQQQPDDATSATTTTTAAVATTTVDTSSGTRTVSTSTTFAEPVFPIVFSCESVLRHPLDGGYVSHTESHRFSVHYVPAENVARAVDTADTDDGSRSSSLVFRSAGACQNERCLTGDSSVSVVTMCGEPDSATTVSRYAPSTSTSTSTVDTAVERRLVVERLLHDAGAVAVRGGTAAVDDHDDDRGSLSDRVRNSDDAAVVQRTAVDGKCRPPEDDERNFGRTGGSHYVLGKGDAVHGFVKAVPPAGANKTIDTFGGDGAEAVAALESHAHEDDMPLLRSDERNYERLTQNHRIIDSGRTVSNQSPIFDDTAGTRLGTDERRRIDPKPVRVNDEHATESGHLPRTDVGSCTKQSADADSTKQSTDADDSTDDDKPTSRPFDNNNYLAVPADRSAENSPVMASYGRNKQHGESAGKHGMTERAGLGEPTDKRHYEHTAVSCKRNIPKRLDDDVSRKREDERATRAVVHADRTRSQATVAARSNAVHPLQHRGESTEHQDGRWLTDSSQPRTSKTVSEHAASNRHSVPPGTRANEFGGKHVVGVGRSDADSRAPVVAAERRAAADAHQREDDTNACHRCTHKSQSHGKNEPKHYGEDSGGHYGSSAKCAEPEDHHGQHSSSHYDDGNTQFSKPKRRLESVDECAESKESNYVGGYLFGDSFYKKQPQKRDPATDRSHGSTTARPKYEYYDDSKKVNFSSKPDGHHYGYYEDYAPKTRHSPRDEDCTVFADTQGRAAEHASYYSQLGQTSYGGGGGDDKNTDSDESLTDSLEDGKCEVGTSVSYFLALNGQKSAVTFTLKMPNTLQSRLNRRQRMLKKHLHVSTTVRKTSMRVRTRHKGCQTLWTEEKGVQVQRGSTANATRKFVADDRKVLETLLAGLERHHVSENQIRVVGGQKMVSEGNQTDKVPEPPTDRHTQTQATRRDVAAGPGTPENHNRVQSHTVKKFSSDNALMVGVVRQNKYKGKEALDGTKNDQLLTLSKGWINFYTLRADSADTADAQGNSRLDVGQT